MKKKYQNIFFFVGILMLAIMVTQLDFHEVWNGLCRAGYWFLASVFLWVFLYGINAASWHIILQSQRNPDGTKPKKQVPFVYLYKLTISGYALNYATPAGLMGGEPYRIMALTPIIGAERATSSVILFAMTHIFSHFWFWLLSIFLYIITQPVDIGMGIFLAAVGAFCCLAIWFFMVGYRKGLALKGIELVSHIPGLKKKTLKFIARHLQQLDNIDNQIAALHAQSHGSFVSAVFLELSCRVLSAFEIYFALLVVDPHANYINCILILAFTSLLANALFFMPMQLGGREGGFLLSTKGLAMSTTDGIFVALIIRVRECIWIAIGLLLIKFEQKQKKASP
ncbi:MAG: flippase-like domain-containing protein [Prevotella sp.]|jgi:hypothetical protein|nr:MULTISPECIES: lysylphosphatidylglycerol synthase transmembrane domain-containing protein [unclassified Prevotella]MCH3971131.1 flippase-like domain-containing protein [Prevotella sp.]MCH3985850.1 flippase-like domain-containing protein [Prevotella sp.]MCH3993106.1 flippase-like domain-containing protein [Prevotella sp.]MCH4018033.1 flippase-like domain-containing protein [Prevotella sp.]MCH4100772.1 flippase-like domain-containing protein [Prevotella sp.]